MLHQKVLFRTSMLQRVIGAAPLNRSFFSGLSRTNSFRDVSTITSQEPEATLSEQFLNQKPKQTLADDSMRTIVVTGAAGNLGGKIA